MMSGSIKKYSKKDIFHSTQLKLFYILQNTYDFGFILYIKIKKLKFQFILTYQILSKTAKLIVIYQHYILSHLVLMFLFTVTF